MAKDSRLSMIVDEDGLPVSDYGYQGDVYIGKQRSIVAAAERGLECWNRFDLGHSGDRVLLSYDWAMYPDNKERNPTDEQGARRVMLNCADWLLRQLVRCGTYSIWEYPYAFPHYGLPPGWHSSQAQAVAMQLLLRAHELTGRQAYRQAAQDALPAFMVAVVQGGLVEKLSEEAWWYEKFAVPAVPGPKVLNGMMFSLLGLLDFHRRERNGTARSLFDKGMRALLPSLPLYDSGEWSYYDRIGRPASVKYHTIHVEQLRLLHEFAQEPLLLEYHERFKGYLNKPPVGSGGAGTRG